MKKIVSSARTWRLLIVSSICLTSSVGCLQTRIGGQTLPSATYLRDDVEFFPAGPEFKLTNQVRALEEYKLEQEAIREGLDEDDIL